MSEQDTDANGTEDEEEKEEDKDIDESEVKDAVELDTSGKVLTDSEIIKKYHFVDSDEDDLNSISDAEEYSPPIAALPPKISKQEENQVEISSSPAYQCLEEVCI